MAYKPTGYASAAPYLVVRDANRTLAFVEALVGAQRLRVTPRENSQGIAHAEARIDDTVIPGKTTHSRLGAPCASPGTK